MMPSEWRRKNVQLLKISSPETPPHDVDMNYYCPISRSETRAKKGKPVAQLFEKLFKINVRKQSLLP